MWDADQKIKLKVAFEAKDILHIYKVNLKKQFRNIKAGGYFLIGLIVFIVLIYILTGNTASSSMDINNDSGINYTSIIKFVIFAVVILSILCILPNKLKKEAVKNFESNKEFQNEIEYLISEEELSGHSITSDFHYEWNYFNNMIETKYAFILYLSNNTVICLPLRCFSDDHEINTVRNIFKDKFHGKKYQVMKIK